MGRPEKKLFTFTEEGKTALRSWVEGLNFEVSNKLGDTMSSHLSDTRLCLDIGVELTRDEHYAFSDAIRKFYSLRFWSNASPDQTPEGQWPKHREQTLKQLDRFFRLADDMGQTIYGEQYPFEDMNISHIWIGNPEAGLFFQNLEQYGSFTPLRDFSDVSPAALRAELGMGSGGEELLPTGIDGTLTPRDLHNEKALYEEELRRVKEEAEAVKEAKSGELAALKAEIDRQVAILKAKQEAMMAELEQKKAELELQKERMEAQIYLLDSQIYSILCYMGETVSFAQVRKGKQALVTEPVVLHQKLRFLDEDLGRLASLYSIDWEDIGEFERFLAYHPAALDTFAPNERCIMLVRLSKTGKVYDRDEEPYSNMLKDYKYYHGKTVGIIIRNGENLYIGWTDEERVHIQDDLIISKVVTEVAPGGPEPHYYSEFDRQNAEKKKRQEARELIDGLVSRNFVYQILQGIVDNSTILPLPDGVKLNKQSQYVIYSVADKWLTDTRFGSFNDIVEEANDRVHAGDMILTVQRLTAVERRIWSTGYYGNKPWENNRGRGDRNRTHDCTVANKTIYPVNLVEYDEPVKMKRYKYVCGQNEDGSPRWNECVTDEDSKLSDESIILEHFEVRECHVYVSVEKTEGRWYRYDDSPLARANMEVYPEEFINLTYLNSTVLEWAINTKTLGGWTIGGQAVDYAYAIQYLNTAMDFIRKREVQEKEYLDAVDPALTQDPEWPLKLCNWKKAAGIRNITPHQAKRYAKTQNADV